VSSNQDEFSNKRRCLYTVPYEKLNLQAGFPFNHEIEAGKEFISTLEVEQPKSIISIMF